MIDFDALLSAEPGQKNLDEKAEIPSSDPLIMAVVGIPFTHKIPTIGTSKNKAIPQTSLYGMAHDGKSRDKRGNRLNPSSGKGYSQFEADADRGNLSQLSQQCPSNSVKVTSAASIGITGLQPIVPVVPPKNTREEINKPKIMLFDNNPTSFKQGEKQGEKMPDAAGSPQGIFAAESEDQNASYPTHPAAVLLVLAWARCKQIPRDERAALLLNLETMEPAEQIRAWHLACVSEGLKPWHILYPAAALHGANCSMCSHLRTKHESIGAERKQFHAACDMGYLILEQGRGTERFWIAPPECQSYERWYPSKYR